MYGFDGKWGDVGPLTAFATLLALTLVVSDLGMICSWDPEVEVGEVEEWQWESGPSKENC